MQDEAQQLLCAARSWLAEWLEEGVTEYAQGRRAAAQARGAPPSPRAQGQHATRAAQGANASHEPGAPPQEQYARQPDTAHDTNVSRRPDAAYDSDVSRRSDAAHDSDVSRRSDAAHESETASSADIIPATGAPQPPDASHEPGTPPQEQHTRQPDTADDTGALSQDQHARQGEATPGRQADADPLQGEGEQDAAHGRADAGSDEQADQPSLFGAPGDAARGASGAAADKAQAPASASDGAAAGKAQAPASASEGATSDGAAHRGAGPVDPEPPLERRSLAAVREELGECTRCGLCKGRTQIVFGDGNEGAELMFIGEGPGEQEDLQGIPFVGRAGELLTRMIEGGLKMPREDVYICNIVKCRPPDNRDPKPEEVAACRPFLDGQIASVRPRVIVALGRPAASLLLGRNVAITRERGQWNSYRGIPVMPTFHPAYVLRRYTEEIRNQVWQDLLAAQAKSREGQPG